MNTRLTTGLLLLATLTAAAALVRGAQPLAFEVATVKPAAPPSLALSGPVPPPPPPPGGVVGDRITWNNMSLRLLIGTAYGLKDFQIVAPDWMKDARFDISAKLASGTTSAQAPAMLQALLEERFKLASHREQRELPVYALIVAKTGSKLHEVSKPEGGLRLEPQRENRKLTGQAALPLVASMLSLQLDRPVIDMTGLRAVYQLDVSWTRGENERNNTSGNFQGAAPAAAVGGGVAGEMPGGSSSSPGNGMSPSIFTAMEETLGLKLDPRKAPVDVLVIDRAERTPAAN